MSVVLGEPLGALPVFDGYTLYVPVGFKVQVVETRVVDKPYLVDGARLMQATKTMGFTEMADGIFRQAAQP